MQLVQPPDEAQPAGEPQRILDALRHIVQVMRAFSAEAKAEVGLTAAQLFALQVVVQNGPLSVNALAARTLTHQSTVSVVARRLVDQGLLRRRTSPQDHRQVLLEPTVAGQRLAGRAPAAVQDRLIAALASLSDPDRIKLTELLKIVVADLAPAGEHPPMFFEAAPRRTKSKTS